MSISRPRLAALLLALTLYLHAHAAFAANPAVVLKDDLQYLYSLTNLNGTLYFLGEDTTHGIQLWKSDGTAAGTVMTNLLPYAFDAFHESQTLDAYDGALYFCAKDPNHSGPGLWRSDGTQAGTVRLASLILDQDYWRQCLFPFNGALYFAASDGSGCELWKSDGTPAGTALVKNINPASNGSSIPEYLTVCNGQIYFSANDGKHGKELWVSDGTTTNTHLVMDIRPGSASSNPNDLMNVNGKILFFADDGVHGTELWRCDAPNAEPRMVKDINPGPDASTSYSWGVACVNGTAYFSANDGTHGKELWKSDGTPAGTVMVKDATSGNDVDNSLLGFTNVDGAVYFFNKSGSGHTTLWKSDGTEAGTIMIKHINLSLSDFDLIKVLPTSNGGFIFNADGGDYGYYGEQIWKSDGTPDGTMVISNITLHGPWYVRDEALEDINGTLYFMMMSSGNNVLLMRLGEKVPVELSGFAAE